MHKITVVLVTLSVVACSSSYQDPTPTTDSNVKSGSSSGSGKGDGSDPSKGADPGADPSGKGSDPGADPSGKGSDPSADPDGGKAGVDPACLTTCNMTMVAKCGGDATICDEVCSLTSTEIACLEAAPTCDKSVWLMCEAAEDGGAPSKGGGK